MLMLSVGSGQEGNSETVFSSCSLCLGCAGSLIKDQLPLVLLVACLLCLCSPPRLYAREMPPKPKGYRQAAATGIKRLSEAVVAISGLWLM